MRSSALTRALKTRSERSPGQEIPTGIDQDMRGGVFGMRRNDEGISPERLGGFTERKVRSEATNEVLKSTPKVPIPRC